MRTLKYIRDCLRDWKEYISFVYAFFSGFSILDIIGIINTFIQWSFELAIIYFIILYGHPFLFYGIWYEKGIKLIGKMPQCKRVDIDLVDFNIDSTSETISTFKFRIGEKIPNYYLFFTKFSDVEMRVSIPNKNDFKQIERKNKDFIVIKCNKNSGGIRLFSLNCINKTKQSFIGAFKIYYSKKQNFIEAFKNKKKICTLKIPVNP